MFANKARGKDFERPECKGLKEILGEGDTLAVESIDRLGRSYEEILNELRAITKEKRAATVVLDMPLLDTHEKHEGIRAYSSPASCCNYLPTLRR